MRQNKDFFFFLEVVAITARNKDVSTEKPTSRKAWIQAFKHLATVVISVRKQQLRAYMEGIWLPAFLFALQYRVQEPCLESREFPKSLVMYQFTGSRPIVLCFLLVARRRKGGGSAKKVSTYSHSNDRLSYTDSHSGSFFQYEGKRCFSMIAPVHQRKRLWTTGLILLFFHYMSPQQLLLNLVLLSSSSASRLYFTLSPLIVGIFPFVLRQS